MTRIEPSNFEQSRWPDTTRAYVDALLAREEELLELVLQYRNDLKFGVSDDSKERRLAAIERALKQ